MLEYLIAEFSEFTESIQEKYPIDLICVDRENEKITKILGLCK